MLREEGIAARKEELESLKKARNDIIEEHTKATEKQKANQARLEEIETETVLLKAENNQIQVERNRLANDSRVKHARINEIERELEEDTFKKAVAEKQKEQPAFLAVVEKRIGRHRDSTDYGFTVFDAPAPIDEVMEKMKSIDASSFNRGQQGMTFNNYRTRYQQKMESICERLVKGENMSLSVQEELTQIVDGFLENPHIKEIWTS